jgi:hypothetical protein
VGPQANVGLPSSVPGDLHPSISPIAVIVKLLFGINMDVSILWIDFNFLICRCFLTSFQQKINQLRGKVLLGEVAMSAFCLFPRHSEAKIN